jgi:hypothetical protein
MIQGFKLAEVTLLGHAIWRCKLHLVLYFHGAVSGSFSGFYAIKALNRQELLPSPV